MKPRAPFRRREAFSLVELLTVLAVMLLLAAMVAPVVRHLGVGNMQAVQAQAQGLFEQAREFAQANRTYVRIGMAETAGDAGVTAVVLQCVHSSTGDLRNDTLSGLADEKSWRSTSGPVVLRGVQLDDSLKEKLPASIAAVSTVGTDFPSFSRKSGGGTVAYQRVVQFDPRGQISLAPGGPTRNAMIGFVNPRQPSNPVILLLSGLSGKVQTVRQEDLQP